MDAINLFLLSVTDNGDGTATLDIPAATITDNGDGSATIIIA